MNWDTHEMSLAIESDELFYNYLKNHVDDELYFMVALYVILEEYNRRGNEVDSSKVNGNEVYVSFCEAVGNETKGWN